MHKEILLSFEQKLSDLSQHYIHPSIARAAELYFNSSKGGGQDDASSRVGRGEGLLSFSMWQDDSAGTSEPNRVSLLDCISVEKEKAWAMKCEVSSYRLYLTISPYIYTSISV